MKVARGPYKKKNDTFSGKVLVEHFRRNLKVYLKPVDEDVITEQEMLQAIEETLKVFFAEQSLRASTKVSGIAVAFLYGFAMTEVYQKKTRQIIHSNHFYSYSLQTQLEIDRRRCKKLNLNYIPKRKMANRLFNYFKSIKRASRSPMLQLLSVNGILLGPMLSLSFAQKQKLKIEDLPRLKNSSFNETFAKDTLSLDHVMAHSLIFAGLKEYFGARFHLARPKLKHFLLNQLLKRGVNTRFSRENLLNHNTCADDTLVEDNPPDYEGYEESSFDNTLVNDDQPTNVSFNDAFDQLKSNGLNSIVTDDLINLITEQFQKINFQGYSPDRYKERRSAIPDGQELDDQLGTVTTSRRILGCVSDAEIEDSEPFTAELVQISERESSEDYMSDNDYDEEGTHQSYTPGITNFSSSPNANPNEISGENGYTLVDNLANAGIDGENDADLESNDELDDNDESDNDGSSGDRTNNGGGNGTGRNRDDSGDDGSEDGSDDESDNGRGGGGGGGGGGGSQNGSDDGSGDGSDDAGDGGGGGGGGGDGDGTQRSGFDLPEPNLELAKQFFEKDFRRCFGNSITVEVFYEFVFTGVLSYANANLALNLIHVHRPISSYPANANIPQNPWFSEIRRINDEVEETFSRVNAIRSLIYCKCLQTVYSRLDNTTLTECPKCGSPKVEGTRFVYASPRLSIMTIIMNPKLLGHVKAVRSRVSNPNIINSIQDGLLFKETLAAELEEKNRILGGDNPDGITDVIYMSVFITADGCNINRKSYSGVFPVAVCFLDLPIDLRTRDLFVDIPMVSKTSKNSAGSTAVMQEILFKDLEDLDQNGMIVTVSPEEKYFIRVKINTISGDIIAVNKLTETKGPSSYYPCTYCINPVTVLGKVHPMTLVSSESNETPDQRMIEVIDVTTQYMRDLVETTERPLPFGPQEIITGYDIKATFSLYHHSNLDIRRVLKGDFMHIYYENIFAKLFVSIFAAKNFSSVDRTKLNNRRVSLLNHLMSIGAFEEPRNTMKIFSAESLKTPIKAADIRTIAPIFFCFFDFVYHAGDDLAGAESYADFAALVLSRQRRNQRNVQLAPIETVSIEEEDLGTLSASDFNDDFRELVYLMVELNTVLQALSSSDVPLELIKKGDTPSIMKASFVALLVAIQLYSEKEDRTKFVDQLFRLSCHMVLHLIDGWEDVGNYSNISCWFTERACNTVRNLQEPAGNVYRTAMKRLIHKFLRDCFDRYNFDEEKLSAFSCPRAAKVKHAGYQREIDEASARCQRFNPNVRVLRTFIAIGTFKPLNDYRRYGKMRINGEWVFFKVCKVIHFEYTDHEEIMLKYQRVEIKRKWKESYSGLLDFCYLGLINDIENAPVEEMLLEQDSEIHSILVTDTRAVLDKHPSFGDLCRLHLEDSV